MDVLDATGILLILAAAFGLVNYHVFKLPFAIGLLVSGLLASFGVILVDEVMPALGLQGHVRDAVQGFNFADTVLSGMLSVLLFAGALHTDLSRLRRRRRAIILLASAGIVISTVVSGGLSYLVFKACGIEVDAIWCFAFGALISPTDPIAVLGIMKTANAPPDLETKVVGESLFNDGTGVVLFTLLTGIGVASASGVPDAHQDATSAGNVAILVSKEILGGVGLGLAFGWLGSWMLRKIDEANLEILVSVAVVFAISLTAHKFHFSAPLAAVAAGLFIGQRGRSDMSEHTAHAHHTVWTFLDETLNAVLFLLIGLVVFAIDTRISYLYAGIIAVPAVLLARLVGVAAPVLLLHLREDIGRGTIRVLTWGGLKGGVSVALAMKLPEFPGRNAILTATYIIVVFSIIVQGLTLGRLIRFLYPVPKTDAAS